MKLLSVDTSTSQVGLALYGESRVLGELVWFSRSNHTIELASAVSELLTRTGIKVGEVGAIGVALGPGSFTSLRVGLSLAKGLALARNIPLVGIPTLDVVAAAQPESDLPLIAVLPAGRGRLAAGRYRALNGRWQADGPSRLSTAGDLAVEIKSPTLVCGEMTPDERQRLARKWKNVHLASPARCVRRPALLAELAWDRWQSGDTDNTASLSPIYLQRGEQSAE